MLPVSFHSTAPYPSLLLDEGALNRHPGMKRELVPCSAVPALQLHALGSAGSPASRTVDSHAERKGLNNVCQFHWVYLLELGLGVSTTLLPETEDVYLSIRFRVRFEINQFPESKYEKIDLEEVGEYNG